MRSRRPEISVAAVGKMVRVIGVGKKGPVDSLVGGGGMAGQQVCKNSLGSAGEANWGLSL